MYTENNKTLWNAHDTATVATTTTAATEAVMAMSAADPIEQVVRE